ncbi:hypothetical protein PR048_032119 [Dryococelus australis]|uniref:Uncharacterized protein n=1 Tax=Dryococelus australis TaxID=614101 RepID=A0ABQ9G443_9NEOP|nr:hypothetical protein PR048_032119 [Dryococelus australis]
MEEWKNVYRRVTEGSYHKSPDWRDVCTTCSSVVCMWLAKFACSVSASSYNLIRCSSTTQLVRHQSLRYCKSGSGLALILRLFHRVAFVCVAFGCVGDTAVCLALSLPSNVLRNVLLSTNGFHNRFLGGLCCGRLSAALPLKFLSAQFPLSLQHPLCRRFSRPREPRSLDDFSKSRQVSRPTIDIAILIRDGFFWGSPVYPALSFRHCSILASITLIGSQDLDVKSLSHFIVYLSSGRKNLYVCMNDGCASEKRVGAGVAGSAEWPELRSVKGYRRAEAGLFGWAGCASAGLAFSSRTQSHLASGDDLFTPSDAAHYTHKHGPMRATQVKMEQCWNERMGVTGDPRENPPTSGIVWHDSHMLKSGSDPAGD